MPKEVVSSPADGQPVNSWRTVEDDYELEDNEYFASLEGLAPGEAIWDAASEEVRPPTTEEASLAELEAVKGQRTLEFLGNALEEFVDINPEARGDFSSISPLLLNQAWMSHFFLTARNDEAKNTQAEELLAKFENARALIDSSETPEDVQAIEWETQ